MLGRPFIRFSAGLITASLISDTRQHATTVDLLSHGCYFLTRGLFWGPSPFLQGAKLADLPHTTLLQQAFSQAGFKYLSSSAKICILSLLLLFALHALHKMRAINSFEEKNVRILTCAVESTIIINPAQCYTVHSNRHSSVTISAERFSGPGEVIAQVCVCVCVT